MHTSCTRSDRPVDAAARGWPTFDVVPIVLYNSLIDNELCWLMRDPGHSRQPNHLPGGHPRARLSTFNKHA